MRSKICCRGLAEELEISGEVEHGTRNGGSELLVLNKVREERPAEFGAFALPYHPRSTRVEQSAGVVRGCIFFFPSLLW